VFTLGPLIFEEEIENGRFVYPSKRKIKTKIRSSSSGIHRREEQIVTITASNGQHSSTDFFSSWLRYFHFAFIFQPLQVAYSMFG